MRVRLRRGRGAAPLDRRRPGPARLRTGLLGLALALAGAAALAGDAAPPLKAMRWVAPGADPARVFATWPAECLRLPADPQARLSVEVGRAAFRDPLVLGGQASRAGLACESCHRAGRDNPDFLFPGISGAPGTADVTQSLFSSHRGNGIADPKPIPDLGGRRARLKVARGELAPFIHGLIVEEFDGPEPPPAVLAGLAAYVGALDPAACAQGRTPVTLALLLDDVRRALTAAQASLANRQTATVLIGAGRARLGLIDERFAGMPSEQAKLRAADARLADLQAQARSGQPRTRAGLAGWLADSRDLEAKLAARQGRSLFDPARLAAAANRRLPPKSS